MMNKALEPAVPSLSKSEWNVKLLSSTSFLNLHIGLQEERKLFQYHISKSLKFSCLIFAKYLGKTHAMRNSVVHK